MTAYPTQPSFLALAFKPLRDMFVFSGRSRRTEVLAFFLLGILANAATVSVHTYDDGKAFEAIRQAWSILWTFPWIALLVRRLHDQGRSVSWAWAVGAAFVAVIAPSPLLPQSPQNRSWMTVTFLGTFHPAQPWASIYGTALIILWLLLLWLYLAPGQFGTNRYGPNPRVDREGATVPAE